MSEEEEGEPLLKLEGMTPELAQLLKEQGYYTVESLAIEAPHILYERIGARKDFDLNKAREIVKEARSQLKVEILTAYELLEEEKKKQYISTGSEKLNALLGGGIRTGELVEAAGPYGSGKTELCYTVAVQTAQQLEAGSFLVDTEEAFSASRLAEIAVARGLNPEDILKRIFYSKVYGTEHLILVLENAHKRIKEQNIRFLAVDSLVSPFRAEYQGRELLATRQQKINRCLRTLLNYARVYNMACLITNQVLATPVAYVYEPRPELQNPPIGGHVVAHAPNNRLYFRAAGGAVRVATLMDSSYLPWGETTFKISKAGIVDIE